MISILVIEEPKVNAVTWWRYLRPLSQMQKDFPGQFSIKMTRRIDEVDLHFYDIVILSRPNDPETLNFVKRIRQIGRAKIIIDIDDAITNLQPYHSQYAYHNRRKAIAWELFSLADYFWVSTEQLMYDCDCFGRGEIMPNAVLAEDLPDAPSPDMGLWMWRGNQTQKDDVRFAGEPIFDKINAKIKKWIFYGVWPSLGEYEKHQHLEYELNFENYFASVKSLRLNGVWKPLVDCKFNDAKSNIAWIEATVSGGICLSNYAGKTAWENAVSELPETYEDACAIWSKSKERILKDFNLVKGAALRADSIARLLNQKFKA